MDQRGDREDDAQAGAGVRSLLYSLLGPRASLCLRLNATTPRPYKLYSLPGLVVLISPTPGPSTRSVSVDSVFLYPYCLSNSCLLHTTTA